VRFDTIGHTLCQPQRPLVCTRFERLLGLDRVPCGVNVICAIAVRGGYNQEDSVILNRASVERGLFQSVKICTYRDEERATGTDNEKFENSVSSAATNIKIANYGTIDEAGCARVGQVLDAGDVVIGKTVGTADAESILKGHRNTVKRDKSVIVRSDAHVVDAVLHSHKTDGTRLVKLRTRQVRTPAVGDKFSSRMGQKGICGRLLNAEDMPYTSDGLVPDILVNPHAMPSRMSECARVSSPPSAHTLSRPSALTPLRPWSVLTCASLRLARPRAPVCQR
jgi:DNA-directed RNA polymerase beta subunit